VGTTGVATGAITGSLMMSSSAATVIRGGGTGATRTDTTVTAITRTVTMDTDTAGTHMVTMDTVATRTALDTDGTVTTVAAVMDTALAAELTRAVTSLNQVAQSIAKTNQGVT
jgi:hypothetical protein